MREINRREAEYGIGINNFNFGDLRRNGKRRKSNKSINIKKMDTGRGINKMKRERRDRERDGRKERKELIGIAGKKSDMFDEIIIVVDIIVIIIDVISVVIRRY